MRLLFFIMHVTAKALWIILENISNSAVNSLWLACYFYLGRSVTNALRLWSLRRGYLATVFPCTVKKGSRVSRLQPGCHKPCKLPLGRNNSVITSLFPPRESLVVTSRLGTGNSQTFFYGAGLKGFCCIVRPTSDNRHRQSIANTRQPGTNNSHWKRHPWPNNQESALDKWHSTTNNYHQQIHPTNKTNTRQQITVKWKCEKSTILTNFCENRSDITVFATVFAKFPLHFLFS